MKIPKYTSTSTPVTDHIREGEVIQLPEKARIVKTELTVVKVDRSDDTVLLENPEFKKRGMGETVWCRCKKRLKVGQKVFGTFDFDPRESVTRGTFPEFFPDEVEGK